MPKSVVLASYYSPNTMVESMAEAVANFIGCASELPGPRAGPAALVNLVVAGRSLRPHLGDKGWEPAVEGRESHAADQVL